MMLPLPEYLVSWLGTPYAMGGSNRLLGCDCAGFVCSVLDERVGAVGEPFRPLALRRASAHVILECAIQRWGRARWIKGDEPIQALDVVFSNFDVLAHRHMWVAESATHVWSALRNFGVQRAPFRPRAKHERILRVGAPC